MKRLTSFSELTRAMVKKVEPVEKPQVKPQNAMTGADQAVLDYFTRKEPARSVTANKATEDSKAILHAEELEGRIGDLEKTVDEAHKKLEERTKQVEQLTGISTEQGLKLEAAEKQHQADQKLVAELRSKIQELQSEPKVVEKPVVVPVQPVEEVASKEPGLNLKLTPDFQEIFDGEAFEMLLTILEGERNASQQAGRERRALLLSAILSANANRASGELARRRAQIQQVFKDSGYRNDPAKLNELGFKLVSGKKHWKIDYGTSRITMSKTPSDFRSSCNIATEILNRCF